MNSRLLGGIAAVLICASPAMAASREDVLEAMGKCAAIAEDKARLACYDGVAPHVKEALSTPPENLGRAPTKEEEESWFGFNLANLFGASPSQQTTADQFGADKLPSTHAKEDAAAQEVESISSPVTDYAYTPFGKFIVFLKNGQVWRQAEGDADHALFHRNPTDNTVTVSRGALGSYNLSLNDSDKRYKVDRVK